jgi:xylose isomerase
MSYFSTVDKIKYEGVTTENPMAFRHYNPSEMVMGKTMKEHLRFAVAYWHTMTQDGSDPFGSPTNIRTWAGSTPMETAKNRVEAFFEILEKLGVEYFCFHDVDIAPEGDSLEEFFNNIDEITDLIKDAAAQVKKGLDISKKLGGENYVFWGGREGYESLLNTDMKFEQDNIARLFKMAVGYGEKIGHKPQFLIEPKPKEPSKHQYDFDAATTMAFIQKYGLEGDFKLNLEANHATLAGHTFEHEMNVARCYDALGWIDANQGDMLLGWDTDEFPTNIYDTTLAMYEILENGGIAPGGINFDSKVRRSSFEMEDLLLAHIAGMDTFARGLKAAAKLKEERFFDDLKDKRYASYNEGIGARILSDEETLESLTEYSLQNGDIKLESSHLEFVKSRLNDYLV